MAQSLTALLSFVLYLAFTLMMSDTLLRVEQLSFSDFWFADGNIVLIAGKSGFKVHRGQLERHSEVFRDLFSIPQPPAQTLIEGCPWVELHDHPAEVACLLTALYDGLCVTF